MLKNNDLIIKTWIYISTITVISVIFGIFYFIISKGIGRVNLDFIFKNPEGMPLRSEGGVKNAIIGSIFLMFIAILFSVLLGVACAIYNTIYCKSKIIGTVINLTVQCIASIPSIIIGLFVYGFFIVTFNVPRSMLTAGIALGIMVFPFVEVRIEKAVLNMDRQFIKDSYSLGIEKDYMCRKLILPVIKKEIVSTGILAGSHAIEATAPLLLTGAVFIGGTSDKLLSPVMALPFHLHMLLGQTALHDKAYATAFVLICILIILHILSEIIISGLGGKIIEYIGNKRY
ncbi:MAG: ABC transporter permease subunit [Pseudoleptotrichia goodfellowii]|nr:ABC transporter permease subunit [Pseudoleptotrichia goodfellowii]